MYIMHRIEGNACTKNRGRRFSTNMGVEILHKKIEVGDFAQKMEGSYFVQEIWGSENLEKKTKGRRFCNKNEGSEIL